MCRVFYKRDFITILILRTSNEKLREFFATEINKIVEVNISGLKATGVQIHVKLKNKMSPVANFIKEWSLLADFRSLYFFWHGLYGYRIDPGIYPK